MFFETGKYRGLVRTVELARIDVADRNAYLPERFAESLRQRLAVIVEIALCGNVTRNTPSGKQTSEKSTSSCSKRKS